MQKQWHLNKQINLAVIVQIVFLAALIVGTWVNLQKQLSTLQYDITRLLETQKVFQQKLEALSRDSIGYEYRIKTIETYIAKINSKISEE